jgi:diguanylate cyclase (GGDEF)-like protein
MVVLIQVLTGALCMAPGWAVAALEGQWLAPAKLVEADPPWTAFDPQVLTPLPRDPAAGLLVRLTPGPEGWPAPPWVLSVVRPPLGEVSLRINGQAVDHRDFVPSGHEPLAGSGRHGFLVRDALPADAQVELLFGPHRSPLVLSLFRAQTLADYQRTDAGWTALVATCLALMVATGVLALAFALAFREPALAQHAAFGLLAALAVGLKSGFLFEPVGALFLAPQLSLWGRGSELLSALFMSLFTLRFTQAWAAAPRWSQGVRALAWAMVITGIAVTIWRDLGAMKGLLVVHALLALALVPATWGTVIWRALRRHPGALVLLAAWSPALLLQAIALLQGFGLASAWTWVYPAGLLAAAFEVCLISGLLAVRAGRLASRHRQALQLIDTDPLTGVLSRRALLRELRHMQNRQDLRLHLGLMFVDIDHFKQINDRLGHAGGDAVLRSVAAVLLQGLPASACIGRLGGEEFLVGLPVADLSEAGRMAESLRGQLGQLTLPAPDSRSRLSASIGVAVGTADEPLEALIDRADQAMYRAKQTGRDRVVCDIAA